MPHYLQRKVLHFTSMWGWDKRNGISMHQPSFRILSKLYPVKISPIGAAKPLKSNKCDTIKPVISANYYIWVTNLVSLKKTVKGVQESALPPAWVSLSLKILQWFALMAMELIWNRSSTQRPMQCSSSVRRILTPFIFRNTNMKRHTEEHISKQNQQCK